MAAAPVSFDFEPAPPTQVEPTTQERVRTYDLIRGVAILGILLANIPWFAGPELSQMLSLEAPTPGTEATVVGWTSALVTGKFRSMLAILFGIGIWLQYEKRSKVLGNWPGGYLKRMLLLGVFGIGHALFIWHGDILFMYAMVGLVACLLATFSDKVLKWIVGCSAGLAIFAAIGLTAAGLLMPDLGPELRGDMGLGLRPEREIQVFREGSYFEQIAFRGVAFPLLASSFVAFLPFLGGLFLFGVLLGRHRVLERPSAHPRTRTWMLVIGLGIALPVNLLFVPLMGRKTSILFHNAIEMGVAPFVSVGLATLLAIWGASSFAEPIQVAIAKVGRTAFSCYILQSIVCTAIFYSWGGALFGKLDRLQMLAVVPAVWAADLLFAHFWLKRYRMGPLEWLWRSLTEGRKLGMRR